MKPVLTIVVPVYNTEQYLEKCLDSLLIPQLDKLEVIVVIDGSPDNSLGLANKYARRYPDTFKVVNKENGGHGSCCNVGLKLATGKYIRFLDSDDWLETDSLNAMVGRLNQTEVDVILTHSQIENVYNNTSEAYGYAFDEGMCDNVIRIEDINFHEKDTPLFSLADCTFNTSTLKKTEIFFSEGTSFDDNIIYTHPYIGVSTVLFVNLLLYHYYVGRPGQSIQSLSPEKYCQSFNEAFRALKVFREIPKETFDRCRVQFSTIESRMIRSLYALNAKTPQEGRKIRLKKLNDYVNKDSRTCQIGATKLFFLQRTSSPLFFIIYEAISKGLRTLFSRKK